MERKHGEIQQPRSRQDRDGPLAVGERPVDDLVGDEFAVRDDDFRAVAGAVDAGASFCTFFSVNEVAVPVTSLLFLATCCSLRAQPVQAYPAEISTLNRPHSGVGEDEVAVFHGA